MRKANWLTAAAFVVALTAFGCDRETNIPEPKIPEKARLPQINDRIEREADQGTRPGTPPAAEPREAERPAGGTER